ncbi:MAG: SPFH domain-containing protein [Bacteroidota bacterium]
MRTFLIFNLLVAYTFFSVGCQDKNAAQLSPDQVFSTQLTDLRLGDGVPLDLKVYLRWTVEDPTLFYRQFTTADSFNHLVLFPRAMEMGGKIANEFISVDSVFSTQREAFLVTMKQALEESLGEEGMSMKEVVVSSITFPVSYTDAMEKVGLQRQMLEAIEQEKRIAIERAEANKEKTEANAKVAIAEAEAEGRVARIKAKTEESNRKSELAKAETAAQITRKKAQADADRNRLLAKAELEKKTDLKNLELQRQQEMDDLEIAKAKKTRQAELEDQIEFANVVQDNPNFANFLINKELASKVGIAVVPTGSNPNVFSDLLNQKINKD